MSRTFSLHTQCKAFVLFGNLLELQFYALAVTIISAYHYFMFVT